MRIRLGGHLAYYHPAGQSWIEHRLEAPTPLHGLLEQLGVPQGEIALVILNDQVTGEENPIITDEDTLRVYPPCQGG
jgi:sulfur carrier protein ThiS